MHDGLIVGLRVVSSVAATVPKLPCGREMPDAYQRIRLLDSTDGNPTLKRRVQHSSQSAVAQLLNSKNTKHH